MQPLEFLVPLGWVGDVADVLPHAILVLVLANMATRHRAHQANAREAQEHDEVSRSVPHLATSVLLLLTSFVYLIAHPHGGMVMSVLVLGMVLTDFFEHEARNVEARNDLDFEKPKAAITASMLVLLYAFYQSLFFVIKPYWNMIV